MQRFLQVSTDEVYGSIGRPAPSARPTRSAPSSPYSASKAGGDLPGARLAPHLRPADAVITRGSNNYGPYQYPEKLIPLFVTNAARRHSSCRSTATACSVRDWIYVRRPLRGHLDRAAPRARPARSTTWAAATRSPTCEITRRILALTGRDESLIRYVADRLGHDRRYALDTTKPARAGLGAAQLASRRRSRRRSTWYRDNRGWWEPIKSGEYRRYYEEQYGAR